MREFTNPLDKIKIAAPCSAKWDEMTGDERRRFCSECRLNVYNLSDMTQAEAENFLINSEGRVCLLIFRRRDGTVITQNCPVGWQAVKKRASRAATALIALVIAFFSGILSLRLFEAFDSEIFEKIQKPESDEPKPKISFGGILENLPEIKLEIIRNRRPD